MCWDRPITKSRTDAINILSYLFMLNKSIFYLLYYAINELRMRNECRTESLSTEIAFGLYFLEKRAYI